MKGGPTLCQGAPEFIIRACKRDTVFGFSLYPSSWLFFPHPKSAFYTCWKHLNFEHYYFLIKPVLGYTYSGHIAILQGNSSKEEEVGQVPATVWYDLCKILFNMNAGALEESVTCCPQALSVQRCPPRGPWNWAECELSHHEHVFRYGGLAAHLVAVRKYILWTVHNYGRALTQYLANRSEKCKKTFNTFNLKRDYCRLPFITSSVTVICGSQGLM